MQQGSIFATHLGSIHEVYQGCFFEVSNILPPRMNHNKVKNEEHRKQKQIAIANEKQSQPKKLPMLMVP